MTKFSETKEGEAFKAFVRDLVLAEKGSSEGLAERLAQRLYQDAGTLAELSGAGSAAAGGAAFDPFSFGAVITLQREGRETLKRRLDKIESVDELRRIAEAQHLGAVANIKDAPSLRRAIIAGAEMRLANRAAAAA